MDGKKRDLFDILGFIIVPIILVFAIWYLVREPYTKALLKISPPAFAFVVEHIPSPIIVNSARAKMARLSIQLPHKNHDAIAKQTPWKASWSLMTLWGHILRPILIPIFLIAAIVWYRRIPDRQRFKGALKLMELAKINAEAFPCLWPAIRAEVYRRDPFVGTWKMPLTTIEWVISNGLLVYKKGTINELPIPPQGIEFIKLVSSKRRTLHAKDFVGLQRQVDEINKTRPENERISISGLSNFLESFEYFSLDVEKCDEILRKQIGRPWRGVEALPPLEQALAISLMALICGGKIKERGFAMMDQISRTFIQAKEDANWNIIGNSYADLSGVDELYAAVQSHNAYRRIKLMISEHYYEATVFMRLLCRSNGGARSNAGKVAPILFHWLKPHNEYPYRVLHKTDAQRPWIEAIAAFTHFHNEVRMRQALEQPVIEGATDSIIRQLHREEWIKSEELAREAENERQEVLAMLKAADEAGMNNTGGSPFKGKKA